jgi:hypothetical protein
MMVEVLMALIHRRGFMVGGAAVTSSLLLPDEAEAAWFWAVARFLGGAAASWAVSKLLDAAWDEIKRKTTTVAIEPDRGMYRVAAAPESLLTVRSDSTAVQSALSESAANEIGSRDNYKPGMHVIPNAFFRALNERTVKLSDAFAYWGAPTTEALKREMPNGGELAGQWWINHSTGVARYVITRSFGEHAHFLPFKNAAAAVAEAVVHGAEPTRPRTRKLVYDPENYEPDASDLPGAA